MWRRLSSWLAACSKHELDEGQSEKLTNASFSLLQGFPVWCRQRRAQEIASRTPKGGDAGVSGGDVTAYGRAGGGRRARMSSQLQARAQQQRPASAQSKLARSRVAPANQRSTSLAALGGAGAASRTQRLSSRATRRRPLSAPAARLDGGGRHLALLGTQVGAHRHLASGRNGTAARWPRDAHTLRNAGLHGCERCCWRRERWVWQQ